MEDKKRRRVIVTETGTVSVDVERSVSLDVPAEWDDEKIKRVAIPKLDEAQWQENWGILSQGTVSELDGAIGIDLDNAEPEIEEGESWELSPVVCDESDVSSEEAER